MHATGRGPHWTWGVTVILMLIIAWLSVAPMMNSFEEAEARDLTPHEQRFASAAGFEDAYDVVLGNCSMCHAREPGWPGMYHAPKNVLLETRADIAEHARGIFLQAGASHAMPPAVIAYITEEERAVIRAWYRDAVEDIPVGLRLAGSF